MVYQALQGINDRHSKPFADGPFLPSEYAQVYPPARRVPPMSKSSRTPSMSSDDAVMPQAPSNFPSSSKAVDANEPSNALSGGHRCTGDSGQSSIEDRRTPSTDEDETGSSGTSIPSDVDPPSETENDEGWEDDYSDDGQANSSHGSTNN